MTMLSCRDISVSFGKNKVLDNVSLEVPSGKVTGLVGPNGCGKSTLIRVLTRIIEPDTGVVKIGDNNIWSKYKARSFARIVAVLAQERGISTGMSVEEVVVSGRTPYFGFFGNLTKNDRLIVKQAVVYTGVKALLSRKFDTLSGGEKQRVLLARALAQNPTILVLDEPTNHLDVKSQFDILELTQMLKITVIMAIHDLTLAARYCDQICLINAGRVIGFGEPEGVLTNANILESFGVNSHYFNCPSSGQALVSLAPQASNTSSLNIGKSDFLVRSERIKESYLCA